MHRRLAGQDGVVGVGAFKSEVCHGFVLYESGSKGMRIAAVDLAIVHALAAEDFETRLI